MSDVNLEEYDIVIIGSGAGGLATAKLLAETNYGKSSLLIEQHSAPGGCSGYFARGNPKRLFDVGATQLVGIKKNEIQNIIFSINKGNNYEFPKNQQINK